MATLALAQQVPSAWTKLDFEDTCSLHGIAPYIGRLKSSIARSLVLTYSAAGDLIADPFCGSGTIPLEALLHNRSVVAVDSSEYAVLLAAGKTSRISESDALHALAKAMDASDSRSVDLRGVPRWVRDFFHPRTLKEALALSAVLKERGESLLLSCLLGILHHQRPGFLSYPSSHLVPYLRSRSFPRERFPEMYGYRDVRSRMERKLARTFSRVPPDFFGTGASAEVVHNPRNDDVVIPDGVDTIITSPPYMNALDYVRDNRLRLWLLSGRHGFCHADESVRSASGFGRLMVRLLDRASSALAAGGYCVLVVGETTARSDFLSHPARLVLEAAHSFSMLRVADVFRDAIPDVRRSRRNGRATKNEVVIVLRKSASRRPRRLRVVSGAQQRTAP